MRYSYCQLDQEQHNLPNTRHSQLFRVASLPAVRAWRKRENATVEWRSAFALPKELSDAVREAAGLRGLEPHDILSSTFKALLLRYQGQLGQAPECSLLDLINEKVFQADAAEGALFEVGIEMSPVLVGDLVLTLDCREVLGGFWRYRTDLFDAETITRLNRNYQTLLSALLANPGGSIHDACLLTDAEWRQIVIDWNDTHKSYPCDRSIPELFEEVAREHGHRVAVVHGAELLTYSELDRRSTRLAIRLAERGVDSGCRVGLALERSVGMIVSMVAILKCGAAYVPLDLAYPAERLQFIAADTDLSVIVTTRESASRVPNGVPVLSLDDLALDAEGDHLHVPRYPAPESTAYIMYTSGSTGTPKGVEVPHRAVVRLVRNATYVEWSAREIFAQIANASFDAITFEVWGALLNGARLVIVPTEVVLSPEAFAAAIQEHGLTAMFLTVALFNLMVARCPHAFRTVRHLLVGGDAVDPRWSRHLLRTSPPLRLINGYGPTECTTFSVTHHIEEVPEDAKTVPIGRPLSNSQAYILDRRMQPVPVGVPGDLYLGGDGLAKGYWRRPEITAERFLPSPFDPSGTARLYKTGDLARYRPDGVIECLGRTDHQVKIRGFRIELGEIEAVLRQHPDIKDCAVLANHEADGAKSLVAYIAGSTLNSGQVREYLKARLPEFMAPAAYVFLDALPLSPNGKVDRQRLLGMRRAPADRNQPELPMTDAQRTIAAAWAKVLGANGIGPDDNFFDVGGDSLRLAALACELRASFRQPFTITDLFEYPTIRSFAARLADPAKSTAILSDAHERARRQRAAVAAMAKQLKRA